MSGFAVETAHDLAHGYNSSTARREKNRRTFYSRRFFPTRPSAGVLSKNHTALHYFLAAAGSACVVLSPSDPGALCIFVLQHMPFSCPAPSCSLSPCWPLQETALFRHRLEELSPAEMGKFIPEQGLFFEVVTPDRKAALRSKLLAIPGAQLMEFDRTTYYRIPFWQAVDLIGKRQVRRAPYRAPTLWWPVPNIRYPS